MDQENIEWLLKNGSPETRSCLSSILTNVNCLVGEMMKMNQQCDAQSQKYCERSFNSPSSSTPGIPNQNESAFQATRTKSKSFIESGLSISKDSPKPTNLSLLEGDKQQHVHHVELSQNDRVISSVLPSIEPIIIIPSADNSDMQFGESDAGSMEFEFPIFTGNISGTNKTIITNNETLEGDAVNLVYYICDQPTTVTEVVDLSNGAIIADDTTIETNDEDLHANNSIFIDDVENEDREITKVKLIQIRKSKNYYDTKGFLYTQNNPRLSKNSYFRCKHYVREKCPARVVSANSDLSDCILRTEHNHLPTKKDLDKEKLSKTLADIIKDNVSETPLRLYLKTKSSLLNEVDPKNIPKLKSKESFIQRHRLKQIPKLPKTITDFMKTMTDKNYMQYSFDARKNPFYRGVWENNGDSNIVFISEAVVELLNTLSEVTFFMDGTFKVLPRHFRRKFRQLYVISILFKGRSYPLAFILMQRKDFDSYDLIFHNLKRMFPSVTVTSCMSDYEAAARKAIKKHYPEINLVGCFFHYVQAIVKAFKRFGMLKDAKFDNALQEVSALALLPNDFIDSGFESIDKSMDKSIRWSNFKDYWLDQWAGAHISVYDLSDRTNNFSESLNNTINSLNGKKPKIWSLIDNLKLIEMHKADELRNSIGGEMNFTERSTEMKRLDEKINNATELFKKTQDVSQFLKNVTFNDRFESFFKIRIFIEGVDNDNDYIDEDTDYEIIPNTFNINLNFARRALKRKATVDERGIIKLM